MKRWRFIVPLLVGALFAAYIVVPAGANHHADPAFKSAWERTDKPVQDGQRTGTWIWAPDAFTDGIVENYVEGSLANGSAGQRLVQYYDKSRMEITNPNSDRNSIWFVTNGLLSKELITGNRQLGDNLFQQLQPAAVNVAGDANDPNGPTYASFTDLLNTPATQVGQLISMRLHPQTGVSFDPATEAQGITVGQINNGHGIAAPFWTFMNSSATIYQNGQFVQGALFQNPYFATGLPISEAYWADVLVGGQSKLVLIQCFERRCLTYTPSNAAAWQVEMGNVGQHYHAWRYGNGQPQPPGQNPPGGQPQPPGQNPPGAGGAVDICRDAVESEFLTLINNYRAGNGLNPLVATSTLNKAAYDHSLDMGTRGYFEHNTPEGVTPTQRIVAAGHGTFGQDFNQSTENIAAGNEGAAATFEQWRTSPGHNANMLDPNVTAIGIGRANVQGSQWGWYWTTVFTDRQDGENCPQG